MAGEAALFLVQKVGCGPVPPREKMCVGTVDKAFGAARLGIGQHLLGKLAHGRDVLGNGVFSGVFRSRAQDQPGLRARHAGGRDLLQKDPGFLVPDPAGDVEARRVGGDDGEAALEQHAPGQRHRLARLGKSRDLHQHGRTRTQPFGLAKKPRKPLGQSP
jgi:hypothetical protein